MTYPVSPELYAESTPPRLVTALGSTLRRLRVLVYLVMALVLAVTLGSVVPLGTWLLLCAAVAVPTLAALLVVATE
jgi:hypothetical protein